MYNINLYCGFAADKRTSMEVYAESLTRAITGSECSIHGIKASSKLERFSQNSWVMRWLRYRSFLRQLRHAPEADVHHVVDHGYAHLLPGLPIGASCVTVHDLIPLLKYRNCLAGLKQGSQRKPHLNLYSLSFLHGFDQIISPSRTTKADLIEQLGIDASKIAVVPPVIADHFRPLDSELIRQFSKKYKLDSATQWVMLSGSEFYKNHEIALDVFELASSKLGRPLGLIKTGQASSSFTQEIAKRGLRGLVRQIFLDSNEDMPLVYNFVDCLLFPSIYEGFGMPVIESIACHTPVVASNGGSLSELMPEFIRHQDPYDVVGLAEELVFALNDSALRQRIKRDSESLLTAYRASNVANTMRGIYRSII